MKTPQRHPSSFCCPADGGGYTSFPISMINGVLESLPRAGVKAAATRTHTQHHRQIGTAYPKLTAIRLKRLHQHPARAINKFVADFFRFGHSTGIPGAVPSPTQTHIGRAGNGMLEQDTKHTQRHTDRHTTSIDYLCDSEQIYWDVLHFFPRGPRARNHPGQIAPVRACLRCLFL